MRKKALSVTLDSDNVLWLRGRAATRSLSEVLDALVTDARLSGRVGAESVRSVRGTIDLPPDDPELEKADDFIRAAFARSVNRPLAVKDSRAPHGPRSRAKRPRD